MHTEECQTEIGRKVEPPLKIFKKTWNKNAIKVKPKKVYPPLKIITTPFGGGVFKKVTNWHMGVGVQNGLKIKHVLFKWSKKFQTYYLNEL